MHDWKELELEPDLPVLRRLLTVPEDAKKLIMMP